MRIYLRAVTPRLILAVSASTGVHEASLDEWAPPVKIFVIQYKHDNGTPKISQTFR